MNFIAFYLVMQLSLTDYNGAYDLCIPDEVLTDGIGSLIYSSYLLWDLDWYFIYALSSKAASVICCHMLQKEHSLYDFPCLQWAAGNISS